jgi:hypothetical protein
LIINELILKEYKMNTKFDENLEQKARSVSFVQEDNQVVWEHYKSLIYYDGDWFYITTRNHQFFSILWVDQSEDENLDRWMVSSITENQLNDYLAGKMQALKLIENPVVRFLDVNYQTGLLQAVYEMDWQDVPAEYKPQEGLYHQGDE